jgi:methylase of polypeptide subunit release factors
VDLGTGSGLFAMHMAEEYPDAKVVGVDISPVQRNSIPSNCQFLVKNILEGLPFDTGSVDLAHSRLRLCYGG